MLVILNTLDPSFQKVKGLKIKIKIDLCHLRAEILYKMITKILNAECLATIILPNLNIITQVNKYVCFFILDSDPVTNEHQDHITQ